MDKDAKIWTICTQKNIVENTNSVDRSLDQSAKVTLTIEFWLIDTSLNFQNWKNLKLYCHIMGKAFEMKSMSPAECLSH